MSQENVETVRRAIEQFNQQFNTEELDLSLFAPDVVLDNSNAVFDDVEVVAHAAVVVTVCERRITHMKAFQSKADALETLGLSE